MENQRHAKLMRWRPRVERPTRPRFRSRLPGTRGDEVETMIGKLSKKKLNAEEAKRRAGSA
jgi:hypothetical protein